MVEKNVATPSINIGLLRTNAAVLAWRAGAGGLVEQFRLVARLVVRSWPTRGEEVRCAVVIGSQLEEVAQPGNGADCLAASLRAAFQQPLNFEG